ncbi:MAG: glycosyltransferase family 8 protein [Thermoguttaceae bacterium]|nr:glycosyltransferase family 8 protein [Thermoguttaceae bacterium]
MAQDEKEKRDTIEVMLVSDANYSAFLATTIVSILKNAAPDDSIRFHIVDAGLDEADRDAIEELKSLRAFDAVFYTPNLQEYAKYLCDDISRFPAVVNYRLFASSFLPETLDKIVYMDVDVVVLASLREFWETPLDDLFLAAAPDLNMRLSHRKAIGLDENYLYFNSGALLMNLKKWREDNITEKLLKIALEIKKEIDFPDQDVLNVYAFHNGYQRLPEGWNVHPRDYVEGKTRLLHYMGTRLRCPRLEILYGYAALTPYGKLPMQSASYRIKCRIRRIVCNFLCFFLFPRKIRRAIRKRFNLG